MAVAEMHCSWMEVKIKKKDWKIIGYCSVAKKNEHVTTPWLADDCDREAEVGSAEQEMG